MAFCQFQELNELDNRLAERTVELEELQEQRDELRDELQEVRIEFDEALVGKVLIRQLLQPD